MGKSSNKSNNQKIPNSPDPVGLYQKFTNAYLGNQPTYFSAENQARNSQDPQRIAEQQGLQNQFGPEQYSQMLSGFNQLDPSYLAAHNALGNAVTSDLAQGYNLAPGQEQQVEQGVRGAQAARGNASGTSAGIAEGYALGDKGAQMYQQRINNAGSFLGSPTIAQQASYVPPVSADRSFAYDNPNAGFQGVQLGNQAFANNVAAAGANNQQQSNPWLSAAGGALSAVGAIAPLFFSDERLKTDVKRIGTDAKGLGLYEFAYKGPKHVGHIAQEVEKRFPEQVTTDPVSGYKMVTEAFAPVQVEGV